MPPIFNSPPNLQAPFADRRETFPHDWKLRYFYNASPKIRGGGAAEKMGEGVAKHAKFRSIL